MEALTRTQCWNLPNNIVVSQNRQWRDLIKLNDKNYLVGAIRGGRKDDIDSYVIKNIPELAYQFKWELMTDNQRLQEKFKYRNNYDDRYSGHYDGYKIEVEE